MISESVLFQNPLAIRGCGYRWERQKQAATVFILSSDVIRSQNLTETDSKAAPNAPAVTMATGPCAEAMP